MEFLDASFPAAEMRTQPRLELWMKAISAILRTVSAGSLREQRAVYSLHELGVYFLHEQSVGQWWSMEEEMRVKLGLWVELQQGNNFKNVRNWRSLCQKNNTPNEISSGFNVVDMFSMYVWHVHNVKTLLKLVLGIWGRQLRTLFWNYCPNVIEPCQQLNTLPWETDNASITTVFSTMPLWINKLEKTRHWSSFSNIDINHWSRVVFRLLCCHAFCVAGQWGQQWHWNRTSIEPCQGEKTSQDVPLSQVCHCFYPFLTRTCWWVARVCAQMYLMWESRLEQVWPRWKPYYRPTANLNTWVIIHSRACGFHIVELHN